MLINYPINVTYDLVFARQRLNWSESKILNYSTKKLRKIIHYAYNWSSYYHRLFKSNSIMPSEIKNFDDLKKIPITNKETLRNFIQEIYSTQFSRKDCQVSLTGGSTGIPMEIRYDLVSSSYSRAVNLRSHMIWGLKPHTKFCVTTPDYAIPKGGRYSNFYPIFNPYYINIYNPIDKAVNFLIKHKIKFLSGYTSHIGLIAQYVLKHQLNLELIGGCGTSDQMTPTLKNEFFNAFGTEIGDLIGSVELNRTAWECPFCNQYHLDIDAVHTEFLDKNYEDCDENEESQIVYTTLHNKATPIIRFAIEDIGIKGASDFICPKYKFPIMKKFVGRMDDIFESPEGKKISPMTWTVVGKRYLDLKHFQFVQTKPNAIVIYVVYDGPINRELEKNLVNDVIRVSWPGVDVHCERVDYIKRPKGFKIRCAINELKYK